MQTHFSSLPKDKKTCVKRLTSLSFKQIQPFLENLNEFLFPLQISTLDCFSSTNAGRRDFAFFPFTSWSLLGILYFRKSQLFWSQGVLVGRLTTASTWSWLAAGRHSAQALRGQLHVSNRVKGRRQWQLQCHFEGNATERRLGSQVN